MFLNFRITTVSNVNLAIQKQLGSKAFRNRTGEIRNGSRVDKDPNDTPIT